ncbi:carboxypeptidase regulatory-like domain-containing protein [Salinicoccus halodurans]|uniref:Carboxypeptidase regulatory-like domain-containing protein n=1 Tax=Salinicoccus halodurans TaxID=407035 RepID=A0AA94HER9_9STAP|nr:carboxypeptidase regulatory-like domain-containing protein [Salinicoccus halodurans]SFK73166.1 Carboxypeptidase regulatory-like domain-containing protein [Salinicoccus halodurans]
MRNTIKRSAVIALLLILLPVPGVAANTAEETSIEESAEQQTTEESTEQQISEETTEEATEESVEENYNKTEEPADEYVPPQNEQPQYEQTTEEPYQSYEESTEEFYYEEETAEQKVEEWTEEVTEEVTEEITEEPTEESYVEPETVEETTEVTINKAEVDEFSIAGKVLSDDAGLEAVTVTLTGDKKDEVTTDENGNFSFTEVPSGEYELQVETPEGYTAEKEMLSLSVEDRGKRGITFVLEETPAEESIETDDQVMADQDGGSSNNLTVILVGVILLALVAILFIVRALRR